MYWLHEQFRAKPAIPTYQEVVKETVQLCDLSDPCEKRTSGQRTGTSAVDFSMKNLPFPHIGLQTGTCWSPLGLGEMAALEREVGAQAELKGMDVPLCCQGL